MRAATYNIVNIFAKVGISIHAAHAGSDRIGGVYKWILLQFQSTLPMRAATKYKHR